MFLEFLQVQNVCSQSLFLEDDLDKYKILGSDVESLRTQAFLQCLEVLNVEKSEVSLIFLSCN